MSSISEESETGDDDQHDGESTGDNNNINQQQNQLPINLNVENCLGDLNIFKEVRFLFHLIILSIQTQRYLLELCYDFIYNRCVYSYVILSYWISNRFMTRLSTWHHYLISIMT